MEAGCPPEEAAEGLVAPQARAQLAAQGFRRMCLEAAGERPKVDPEIDPHDHSTPVVPIETIPGFQKRLWACRSSSISHPAMATTKAAAKLLRDLRRDLESEGSRT